MRIQRTLTVLLLMSSCFGQDALTWNQVKERFLKANPSLQAGNLNIQESKANEITAGLRPNPVLTFTSDQFQFSGGGGPFRPLSNAQLIPTVTQLWERRGKRGLRVQSAQLATAGAQKDRLDLERTLLFNLRDAYNRTLQAVSLLDLAKDNLVYYDKVIQVNQDRFRAGDISKLDLQRVELQKAQFESDLANAQVNLRTAKIQLLSLLNDQTPVDQFAVAGDFDYKDTIVLVPELRKLAVDNRPDLQSIETAVEKAKVDNRLAYANGSWDPTIGGEYLYNSQVNNTIGLNLSIPIRIFDRNQGEKERTALEIRRQAKLRESLVSSIYRDVESAYAQVDAVRTLLHPYRDKYLEEARQIRDLVSFSYSNGGASLVEFLDAQKSYRDTQLAYRNLIGSYLSAVAQLNLAVGQEVL